MWFIKKFNYDFQAAKEKRLLQMNELEELRKWLMIMPEFTKKRLRGGMSKRL